MIKGSVETGKAYVNSLESLDADWTCESDDDGLELFGIKTLLVLLKVGSAHHSNANKEVS